MLYAQISSGPFKSAPKTFKAIQRLLIDAGRVRDGRGKKTVFGENKQAVYARRVLEDSETVHSAIVADYEALCANDNMSGGFDMLAEWYVIAPAGAKRDSRLRQCKSVIKGFVVDHPNTLDEADLALTIIDKILYRLER